MPLQSRTPYVNIATVEKTQGLHGELVIRYDTGLPFVLSEAVEVWFTPPLLKGVNSARVEFTDDGYPCALVGFEGVDSIHDAATLVGRNILVRRADVEDSGDGYEYDLLIGRDVVCRRLGYLGTIEGIIETPANMVWEVEGPYGEVLIPVIEQVILEVPDDVELPIHVELLKGLIDEEALVIDEVVDECS